jgi:uncharacterized protein
LDTSSDIRSDAPVVVAILERILRESRPRSRHFHWARSRDKTQLLVVDGSRLYDVDDGEIQILQSSADRGDAAVEDALVALGLPSFEFIDDTPVSSPPLRAISLAIAQKCNLGCTYCYASEGSFGAPEKKMEAETARRSIDLLLADAGRGERINVAFLGGEPLTNRAVLRQTTEYAQSRAARDGVHIGFSITTNGTLLNQSDAEFFEHFGFAVTLSLDGLRDDHDRQRPFKGGRPSFDRILQRADPLLRLQRKMQVSVRTTVTPNNLQLREGLEFFLGLGFHSVGFSPVLRSPNGRDEMPKQALDLMLGALVECGMEFERRTLARERYAFANVVNALREIHAGTHRPYPCGAGAGYMGISAQGELSACHRFVGDDQGFMGNLDGGIDRVQQNRWLAARHVHRQEPCRSCWARYMCGGGCHHEVIARGRPACDFIRGWLHYCLEAYGRLSELRPECFAYDFPSSLDAGRSEISQTS